MTARPTLLPLLAIALAAVTLTAQQAKDDGQSFKFRSAVELVNVTATVTDANGRFVPRLEREDFRIFEDGVLQPITQFSSERVPVSLGIALDTSGSMEGEKMSAAREALRRFLFDLLDPGDEVFLYRFSNIPELVEGWTTNRERLDSRLGRLMPDGGTAMYDAVAEAVPLAQKGRNRKKALLVISDGNDRDSETTPSEVRRLIRDTDVIVYAIGIDGRTTTLSNPQGGLRLPQPRSPFPLPYPFPGGGTPRRVPPAPPRGGSSSAVDERVDADALREITDDSGGRTEIVRYPRDLDPATAGIADELSKQYSLGYATTNKDGRWHTIVVEVRGESYHVRARRGYVANPNP